MSRLRRNDGSQCHEGAALELLHRADTPTHHVRRLVERELPDNAQRQGLTLIVTQPMKQRERILLAYGSSMRVLGRGCVPGIRIRVEWDETGPAGSSPMLVNDPGVSNRERQGAHSLLVADDRRKTREQSEKDILRDRLWVIDAVEAQISENTR